MTSRLFRLISVASLAALLTGACSDGEENGADRPTVTTTDDAATTSTAAATSGTTTTTVADDGSENRVIELSIVGGSVEGGVRRETVKADEQVTIRVTSDVADELHVHAYDLKVDLTPGQTADLTFLAKIPGVFEVELEKRGKKVLELEVRP